MSTTTTTNLFTPLPPPHPDRDVLGVLWTYKDTTNVYRLSLSFDARHTPRPKIMAKTHENGSVSLHTASVPQDEYLPQGYVTEGLIEASGKWPMSSLQSLPVRTRLDRWGNRWRVAMHKARALEFAPDLPGGRLGPCKVLGKKEYFSLFESYGKVPDTLVHWMVQLGLQTGSLDLGD